MWSPNLFWTISVCAGEEKAEVHQKWRHGSMEASFPLICLEPIPVPGPEQEVGRSWWSPSFPGELSGSLRESHWPTKRPQWALSGVMLKGPSILLCGRWRRLGWSEESDSHRMNGFMAAKGTGGQPGERVLSRGKDPQDSEGSAFCI